MLIAVDCKLFLHGVTQLIPLLFQTVVLLKSIPDMSLVLFIMRCDLGLTFLEDFNLESSFARPLLSEVFIQLLY